MQATSTLTDQLQQLLWTGDSKDTATDTGNNVRIQVINIRCLRNSFLIPDNDYPDESSTLSKLSKKSKPRSKSVDRSNKVISPRSAASVSEDSGNSSLNTYNTDTIQTNNSDWINVPRGYNLGWY